jgi:hypothetical protein
MSSTLYQRCLLFRSLHDPPVKMVAPSKLRASAFGILLQGMDRLQYPLVRSHSLRHRSSPALTATCSWVTLQAQQVTTLVWPVKVWATCSSSGSSVSSSSSRSRNSSDGSLYRKRAQGGLDTAGEFRGKACLTAMLARSTSASHSR